MCRSRSRHGADGVGCSSALTLDGALQWPLRLHSSVLVAILQRVIVDVLGWFMTVSYLDPVFRGHVRFFAFLLGNGTLVPYSVDVNAVDYNECIRQQPSILGDVFAVYLNTVQSGTGSTASQATQRAAEWLMLQCHPNYHIDVPFAPPELLSVEGTQTVIDTLKAFTRKLGTGTLEPNILDTID